MIRSVRWTIERKAFSWGPAKAEGIFIFSRGFGGVMDGYGMMGRGFGLTLPMGWLGMGLFTLIPIGFLVLLVLGEEATCPSCGAASKRN